MKLHDISYQTPYSESVEVFFAVRFQLIMLWWGCTLAIFQTVQTLFIFKSKWPKDTVYLQVASGDLLCGILNTRKRKYLTMTDLSKCTFQTFGKFLFGWLKFTTSRAFLNGYLNLFHISSLSSLKQTIFNNCWNRCIKDRKFHTKKILTFISNR